MEFTYKIMICQYVSLYIFLFLQYWSFFFAVIWIFYIDIKFRGPLISQFFYNHERREF